jgi:iron complex outermembrane receptor protein
LKRIILKGTFNSMISNILNLRLAADNELALVETNNYDCRKSRNVLSFDAAADLNIMRWLSANLLLRETIQDDRFLAPDFSAGADIKPFGTKENFIKLNFAKNSRIATLNDLYWSPGGNPDLRNESGYIAEITLDLSTTVAGSVKIGTDLTFYHNRISDLIQWRPGEYSYWQADNVDDLVSKGMEANINIMFHGPSYNFKMMSGYTHIISGSNGKESTGSSGRRLQLIYVPADMFNTFIRAEWKKFYSTVRFNYTGKRFVDADNTIYLSPYTVTDLDAGIKLTLKKTLTDIRMGVENIFNIDYQNIAYYPMPRRNFTASVLFQIKK